MSKRYRFSKMIFTRYRRGIILQLDGSTTIYTGLGAESKTNKENGEREDVLSEVHSAQDDMCYLGSARLLGK